MDSQSAQRSSSRSIQLNMTDKNGLTVYPNIVPKNIQFDKLKTLKAKSVLVKTSISSFTLSVRRENIVLVGLLNFLCLLLLSGKI